MGYTPYHQPISKSVNLDVRVNRQLESRMREIRQSGSEGGGAQTNAFSLPLSKDCCAIIKIGINTIPDMPELYYLFNWVQYPDPMGRL